MIIKYDKFIYDNCCMAFFDKYTTKESLEGKIFNTKKKLIELSKVKNIYLLSSFMKESLLLSKMLANLNVKIPTIYIDFGISPEFKENDFQVYEIQRKRSKEFKNIIRILGDGENIQPIKQALRYFKMRKIKPILIDGSYPAECCTDWLLNEKIFSFNWGNEIIDYNTHYETHPLWQWSLYDVLSALDFFGLNNDIIHRTAKWMV